jgi:hypothetical protein
MNQVPPLWQSQIQEQRRNGEGREKNGKDKFQRKTFFSQRTIFNQRRAPGISINVNLEKNTCKRFEKKSEIKKLVK